MHRATRDGVSSTGKQRRSFHLHPLNYIKRQHIVLSLLRSRFSSNGSSRKETTKETGTLINYQVFRSFSVLEFGCRSLITARQCAVARSQTLFWNLRFSLVLWTFSIITSVFDTRRNPMFAHQKRHFDGLTRLRALYTWLMIGYRFRTNTSGCSGLLFSH